MHVEVRDQIKQRSVPTDLPGCRFCSAPLRHTFVDLGMSPLCESYVPAERLGAMEPFYPLHVRSASSASWCSSRSSWRRRRSSPSTPTSRPTRTPGSLMRATTSSRWSSASGSDGDSQVVELASNDGYLLQHVVERGIPALGVEPAANVARSGPASGGSRRWSSSSAGSSRPGWSREGRQADLLVAQQRLRSRPRPQRLRRRHEAAAGAAGRGDDRVSPPRSA